MSTYASRLRGFDVPTVWHEFTPLAQTTGAVNLGQGFPDWSCPAFVKEGLHRAVDGNHNQYCRSGGHMRLVKSLAAHYSPLLGRTLDPLTEITTTVGATEAIFACTQSLLNPGDEVVVFEPAFDIYGAQVQMAGGICKYVPLRVVDRGGRLEWTYDHAEFEAAFTSKTKMVLLNTPHNPTGKVFTRTELSAMAATIQKYPGVIVVADEVYEKLVFAPHTHERMATLPGMFDRTITVSSAGKTFSVTGWKIGWTIGPSQLIKPIMLANQWVQFSVSTTLQEAVADAVERGEQPHEGQRNYFDWLCADYYSRRDRLAASLAAAGFGVAVPEGGFFIVADTSKFTVPEKYLTETTAAAPVMTRDWAFCRWLAIEHGVAAIPPSAFHSPETKGLAANLARFAFCKTDATLLEADKRLRAFGASQGQSQQ